MLIKRVNKKPTRGGRLILSVKGRRAAIFRAYHSNIYSFKIKGRFYEVIGCYSACPLGIRAMDSRRKSNNIEWLLAKLLTPSTKGYVRFYEYQKLQSPTTWTRRYCSNPKNISSKTHCVLLVKSLLHFQGFLIRPCHQIYDNYSAEPRSTLYFLI